MTLNNRLFCSTPEEILGLLTASGASEKDLGAVERFVRRCFDPVLRDFATSLVILGSDVQTEDVQTTLGAQLQIAPGIADLPILRREGDQPPYAMGRELGFRDEVITDPLLMRAGCLFLTRDSAAQVMLELLCGVHKRMFLGDGQVDCNRKLIETLGNPKLKKEFMSEIAHLYADRIDIFAENIQREVMKEIGLEEYLEDVAVDDAVIEQNSHFAKSVIDGIGSGHTSGIWDGLNQRHLGASRLDPIGEISEEQCKSRRILVQGMGDLSFNNGCVAFYRDDAGDPHVILPRNEPYDLRSYTCMVAWKSPPKGPRPNSEVMRSIEDNRFGAANEQFAIIRLRLRPTPPCIELEDGRDISELVDFAVSGRQIIDAGKVVPAARIAPDFSDRRHVFRLPNIGKVKEKVTINGEEKEQETICQYPLFGREEQLGEDVWLLEQVLIEHDNLTKVACHEPISVPLFKLGCGEKWADKALLAAGYKNTDRLEPVERGQYAWRGKAHRELRVFLERNVYPCTMIGLGNPDPKAKASESNRLYLLAWGHSYHQGYTIWEAAEVLRAAGARYALVIDEGGDVFQVHIPPDKLGEFKKDESSHRPLERWMPVHFAHGSAPSLLGRHLLRASIAFWQGPPL